jgi:hypothetical protein
MALCVLEYYLYESIVDGNDGGWHSARRNQVYIASWFDILMSRDMIYESYSLVHSTPNLIRYPRH